MDTNSLIVEPECYFCRHVLEWPTCQSFPKGIPMEIRLGKVKHREPYPGDNGIRFEPVEKQL